MMKRGLQLPEPKKPNEVDRVDSPRYCLFHRCLGHTIEECFVFKDLLESMIQRKEMDLAAKYRLPEPSVHFIQHEHEKCVPMSTTSNSIISLTSLPDSIHLHDTDSTVRLDREVELETGWDMALSHNSKKMMKKLAKLAIADIRRKPPTSSITASRVIASTPAASVPVISASAQTFTSTASSSTVISITAVNETIVENNRGKKRLQKLTLKDFLCSPDVKQSNKEIKRGSVYMVSHLDEFSNATDSDIEGNNESGDMQSWELSDNELIAIMTSIPKGMVLDSDDESEKDQPSTSQPNIETKVEDEASPESEPVHEVFLRSGKVLPPRKPSDKDKGKQILTENPLADEPVNKKDRVTAPLDKVDYNVVAHLKKIPALLSIFDALMLSPEIRESLVTALTEPEEYQVYFTTEREVFTAVEGTHHGGINFSNDDLMLGTEDHNRPLYVTAMTNNTKLNRIFVDQGASVNLMPLKTLAKLRISPSQLNTDKVMLKGFNDQSEQALGSITIPLRFGKLKTEAKFHVIDVNTSYKALLGRPWIHENGMVPSTLHQCMKFCLNGAVGNIPGDAQPFAVHEIGLHEDALYYHTPIVSTSAKVNKPEISQEKPELNIQEKAALKHEPTKHHPVVFGRGGRGDRGRGRKNYNARIPPPITRHGVPIGLYFDSSDSSSDDCQYQFRQGRVMSYRE